MKAVIFDYNRTIFNPDTESLNQGAQELLDTLKNSGCKKFLVSRSKNEKKRMKKIERLGITPYFEKILVVEEKTIEVFQSFKQFCTPGTDFFVVGDRPKREIRTGNELGMTTIRLKTGKFKDESPRGEIEEPDFTITSLLEAADIIQKA